MDRATLYCTKCLLHALFVLRENVTLKATLSAHLFHLFHGLLLALFIIQHFGKSILISIFKPLSLIFFKHFSYKKLNIVHVNIS